MVDYSLNDRLTRVVSYFPVRKAVLGIMATRRMGGAGPSGSKAKELLPFDLEQWKENMETVRTLLSLSLIPSQLTCLALP